LGLQACSFNVVAVNSPRTAHRLNTLLRRGRGLSVLAVALFGAAVALPREAAAAPVDYSDDPNNPTVVSIDAFGKFLFDGHVGGTTTGGVCTPTPGWSCADYITVAVPEGLAINSINLDFYNSTDDRAFVAVQAGTQYTATTGVGALAYNHFGWRGLCATTYGASRLASTNNPTPPSATYNCTNGTDTEPRTTPISTNLFTNVLTGSPKLGAPLTAGSYTFWIQQVSGDSEYTFTVSTINVPAPLPLLGAGAAFGWSRRLRRRLRSSSLV
jgi:hypothetical protein